MSTTIFGSSSVLNEIPNFLGDTYREPNISDPESRIRHYEALLSRHGRHPYFLVRLGYLLQMLGNGGSAVEFYHEAQVEMAARDISDPAFDVKIYELQDEVDHDSRDISQLFSSTMRGEQHWKPTKSHSFPLNARVLPVGHEAIKHKWQSSFPPGSSLFRRYLNDTAIETSQIEGVFLMTVEATQDLIRRGMTEGTVMTLPDSKTHDKAWIKEILNDTLSAYDLLRPITEDITTLTPETICAVHARLMDNARFDKTYIPPGHTRSITRKTVFIDSGNGDGIQCCPHFAVDGELLIICKTIQIWLEKWDNPFAIASWLHFVLARCHPFNDGNGRTCRLIASIPLMLYGYPPISIPSSSRVAYTNGINQAYLGNHGPMIQCIVEGMHASIEKVSTLTETPGAVSRVN